MKRRLIGGVAISLSVALAVTALLVACATGGAVPKNAAYRDAALPVSERVADLISLMTLEEKIGQMTQVDRQYLIDEGDITRYGFGSLLSGGGSAPAENVAEAWADMYDGYQEAALSSRLGIPLIYGIDAVHGHNNVRGAVIFPHEIGLGAAGEADLVERIARATAIEVAATGIDWDFAPCIAVPRDERWGRTYEGFSEDTALVSVLGAAAVRGYQGEALSAPGSVLATAKHYLADGGTMGGKDRGDARISEEELRSIHLAPYATAIEAGAGSVMASFSSWNGEKMHGNAYLLGDVLRGELGFEGLIVSDWAALNELPGTYDERVAAGINAGIDMVMVPDDYPRFIASALKLAKAGTIPESRIDDAVSRILTAKFAMALFERPFTDRTLLAEVGSPEHRKLAREAVRKSLVLLKNDGVLPLSPDTMRNVLVTGPLADNLGAQCGGWTITWQGSNGDITEGTTILAALREGFGPDVRIFTSMKEAEGVKLDAAIVVVGERPYAEGQGDTKTLALASSHTDAVKKAKEAGVPVVTVLISGRPLIVNEALEASDAFVAAWLPGTEGQGVADVILGKYAPTGKLSYTWPRSLDQVPINVGDAVYDPLYPFGFGLSF